MLCALIFKITINYLTRYFDSTSDYFLLFITQVAISALMLLVGCNFT